MADITLVRPGERDLHHTRSGNVKVAYLVEREIDLEDVASRKGSALAAGDVVIALKIPARSVIQGAYVAVDEKLSAAATVSVETASGTSLIATADVGGADAGDIVAAATPAPVVINTDTDFVHVELSTVTANSTGKFRVAIEVLDLTKARRPGLAQLGS